MKYVRQRVKTLFEKIKEKFLSDKHLINRWKYEAFQGKKINIKELQRRAARAVNEMFQERDSIKTAMASTTDPIHR